MIRSVLWALAVLLLAPALATAPLRAPPPPTLPVLYCQPIAFRDRVLGVGWYEAVIRAAPGCTRPARVRKENPLTGSVIGEPSVIPLGTVERVWVFTHRLTYTLDGRTWQRLVVR